MRRRTFLAALPAAAAVSGCTGDFAPGGLGGSETPASAGSTVDATLRSAYRYVVNVDGIDVRPPERDQFAFVRPPPLDGTARPTDGGGGAGGTPTGPPPGAFALVLDDERFEPVELDDGLGPQMPGIEEVYVSRTRRGWLAFDVPAVETESAALVYDGVRFPLTSSDRHRLARAPEFRLDSVSVPESVAPNERVELGVTVTNEGDREGVFLANFRHGENRALNVRVAPGETESESVRYEASDESGTMTFDFDYAGGDRNYEVAVRSATTDGAG